MSGLNLIRSVALAFTVILAAMQLSVKSALAYDEKGLPANSIPCGSPVFYGMHAEYNSKDGSFNETVRVIFETANGLRLWGDFGYPWHYASEADNPFSRHSKIPSDAPIPAQLPPPDLDIYKEPTAVQLTLKFTDGDGKTKFEKCPQHITLRGLSVSEILRIPARTFK